MSAFPSRRPAPVRGPARGVSPALRLEEHLAAGRLDAARLVLTTLRRAAPADPALAAIDAQIMAREGRQAEALLLLDAAMEQAPDEAILRRVRAGLLISSGNLAGAVAEAAEAVVLDRTDPAGKALLGHALSGLGHYADALACLTEALAIRPADVHFRLWTARALERSGDAAAACRTLQDGIALAASSAELRDAAMLLCLRMRDAEGVLLLGEQARRDGIVTACGWGLAGHALSLLNRPDEASAAYAAALALAPDDAYVRHLVAAAGLTPAEDRAPGDYVRVLFDGYADRFDAHLIALGYRVPGLVQAALLRHLPSLDARHGPVLDLGCGTGLLAVACLDLPLGPWVGVDLSGRMVDGARAKGLYDELHVVDLLHVLETETRAFPVILAGDVLCYFGDLAPALRGVRSRLLPGGLFVTSLEMREAGADVHLGNRARYSHTIGYVRSAAVAAGFFVREIDRQMLRYEEDRPVSGVIVVLEAIAD